jgi:hypothetical protein
LREKISDLGSSVFWLQARLGWRNLGDEGGIGAEREGGVKSEE